MRGYVSQRHRKMMDQSEFALQDATESPISHVSRVASAILGDSRSYRLWESQHADLILPAAETSNKKRQIIELRKAEIKLVHRRALFGYLRTKKVTGEERRQLFSVFHRTRDYENAVLAEHRQYMVALSSHVSADYLIDIMNDPKSKSLPRRYKKLYAHYFEMYCYLACKGDSKCVDLVRGLMAEVSEQLKQLRRRIETEPPESGAASFDRQEALARSGRYPVLNYMVG